MIKSPHPRKLGERVVFNLGEDQLSSEKMLGIVEGHGIVPRLSEKGINNLKSFRAIVEEKVSDGNTYYGINTGFGLLADVSISSEKLSQLQLNLVRSHACGIGEPIDAKLAQSMLIVKAHNLSIGYSGIRPVVVETIQKLVDADISPVIPWKGSVGASGDLAPLAHLALALIGEGDVIYKGEVQPAAEVLSKEGISPLVLEAKEGLALINGTQFMTALGAYATAQAWRLARAADIAACLSLDAIRGSLSPFDERIHKIRPQPGQGKVAANVRAIFSAHDDIVSSHSNCSKVQDPYSFRCVPQVHGASRDAIQFVDGVVERELNSVTDNPLVFQDGAILSGGNFHGEPIAMALDFLGIAVAEFGSISERRIEKLTNPTMSDLPAFIIKDSGLNSGYMIPHVAAAALASENKLLAHPAVVDSIPTSADKEDHVSMGPIGAKKAIEINKNVASILAIEILAACQGIDLLAPLKPNGCLLQVYDKIRSISPYMEQDRALSKDIGRVTEWILEGGLDEIVDTWPADFE